MSSPLRSLAQLFIRTIFPASCVGCGAMDTWLCISCQKETPVTTERRCPACLTAMGTHAGCAHPLTELVPTGRYRGTVLADAIQALKYQYIGGLAEPLGERIAAALRPHVAAWKPVLLVPIPLHTRRYRERGFNQAERIARVAGMMLHIPVRTDILCRRRKTHRQVRLERDERLRNLRDAFVVNGTLPAGHTIILLDDVWTTGATMAAAATVLKHAGARTVIGVVVASDAEKAPRDN